VIPDEDHSSADRAIYIPEPEAKEDRVVSFVAQLGPEEEEVVPEPVSDPVINPVRTGVRGLVVGRPFVGQTGFGGISSQLDLIDCRAFDGGEFFPPIFFDHFQFLDPEPVLKSPDDLWKVNQALISVDNVPFV